MGGVQATPFRSVAPEPKSSRCGGVARGKAHGPIGADVGVFGEKQTQQASHRRADAQREVGDFEGACRGEAGRVRGVEGGGWASAGDAGWGWARGKEQEVVAALGRHANVRGGSHGEEGELRGVEGGGMVPRPPPPRPPPTSSRQGVSRRPLVGLPVRAGVGGRVREEAEEEEDDDEMKWGEGMGQVAGKGVLEKLSAELAKMQAQGGARGRMRHEECILEEVEDLTASGAACASDQREGVRGPAMLGWAGPAGRLEAGKKSKSLSVAEMLRREMMDSEERTLFHMDMSRAPTRPSSSLARIPPSSPSSSALQAPGAPPHRSSLVQRLR